MTNHDSPLAKRTSDIWCFLGLVFVLSGLLPWTPYPVTRLFNLGSPFMWLLAETMRLLGLLAPGIAAICLLRFVRREPLPRFAFDPARLDAYKRVLGVCFVFCLLPTLLALFIGMKEIDKLESQRNVPFFYQEWFHVAKTLILAPFIAYAMELGWRCYLLPRLTHLGARNAALLHGLAIFAVTLPDYIWWLFSLATTGLHAPMRLVLIQVVTHPLTIGFAWPVIFAFLWLRYRDLFLLVITRTAVIVFAEATRLTHYAAGVPDAIPAFSAYFLKAAAVILAIVLLLRAPEFKSRPEENAP